MATTNRSLQDHKSLIIRLYKQHYPEEEIVKHLGNLGVETTFSDVQQHLETWHVIPCPSPVHSKDTDTPSDRPEQARHHKLGVTCHHGEASHISEISLAGILPDSTPIQKYQQDKQPHEELAYKLQLPVVDDDDDDDNNNNNTNLDGELTKVLKQMRSDRERINSTAARLAREKRRRKRPNGIRK